MGLLTILNLILVLLASFAIIILFIRQNQLLHLEKKYQQLNEELEETIANFFIQMKEENERFLEKFQQVQKSDIKRATSQLDNNEQESEEKSSKTPNTSGIKVYEKVLSQNEPSENKVDDQQFTSDYEKEIVAIQTMLEQGLTVEKIAQKLNKGHTEIELLIKFSPKLRKVMEEN